MLNTYIIYPIIIGLCCVYNSRLCIVTRVLVLIIYINTNIYQ